MLKLTSTAFIVCLIFTLAGCGGGSKVADTGLADAGDVIMDQGPMDVQGDKGGLDTRDPGQPDLNCECEIDDDCESMFPDMGQCEEAVCNPDTCKCEKVDAQEGKTCDDGEECTFGDFCKAGECVPGEDACDCQGDDDCEPFEDGDLCNGTLYCDKTVMPTVCKVDPDTVVECEEIQLVCKSNDCIPDTGLCEPVPAYEGDNCEDGDPCTLGDICVDGTCTGQEALDCDDQNPCTMEECVAGEGCAYEAPVGVPGCDVQAVIDDPARAATLDGEPLKAVAGHVISPAGPIAEVIMTLNGEEMPVETSEAGEFTAEIDARQGMNTVEVRAVDGFGRADHAAHSFYWSPSWYSLDISGRAAAEVMDGVLGFLGPEAWDDNDITDVDDLATLVTLLADGFDVTGFVPNPVMQGELGYCQYSISILDVTWDDLAIELIPMKGGLFMKFVLTGVNVEVDFPQTGPDCQDLSGHLVSSKVSVWGKLNMSMTGGVPVVSVGGVKVLVSDLALQPNCEPHCALIELLRAVIEVMAAEEIEKSVPGLVEEALATTIQHDIDVAELFSEGWPHAPLSAGIRFSTMSFQDDGVVIGLAVGVTPMKEQGPDTLGSIGRAGCLGTDGGFFFPKSSGVEIAVYDDLLNQLSAALHGTGALSFPVSGDQIAGYGVDPGSAGITDMSIELEALLPPIITSCNALDAPTIQVGDLSMLADMKLDGASIEARLYASLAAPIDVQVEQGQDGEDSLLKLSSGQPDVMVYDIELLDDPSGMGETALREHIEDTLKAQLTAAFASIEFSVAVPAIQLDYYMKTYLGQFLPDYFPQLPEGTFIDLFLNDAKRWVVGHYVLGWGN